MNKINLQSYFGRKQCNLLFSITVGAAWLWLVDRGAAFVMNLHGAARLTVASGLAMFGWAALVLVGISAVAAGSRWVSGAVSRWVSMSALSPVLTGALLAAAAAVPFYIVGRDFAAGDWISHQSYAWAVHAVPAVLGPLGVAVLGWLFFRFDAQTDSRVWRRRFISLLYLLVSSACTAVSLNLPYNSYPNFQLLLYGLSLAAILAAVFRVVPLFTRRFSTRGTLVFSAITLLIIAVTVVSALAMNRKTRSELAMKSMTMGQVARKTGGVFSGSLLQNTLQTIQRTSADSGGEDVLKRGLIHVGEDWNVLLMVVDCLRADALPPNRKKGQKHAKDGDTPFLDKLIKESFTFQYAYSQGSRTMASMPVTFRSLETFDDSLKRGVPLGSYMKSLGKTPVAVVNDVFARPWRKRQMLQDLLVGFEHVSIFEEKEMDTEIDRAMSIFKDDAVRPFFAWMHFQSVHTPYFDGRQLTGKDGSSSERYRRGLKWADGEMARLFSEMKRIGILDKTIVILSSDHGENLGDNPAQRHGFSVYEEAIRVPLVIRIPGQKGRIIHQTVGNIDIVPTIADLLGAPLNPLHRGRSLVPLMANPKQKWRRTYFTRNAVGRMFSVVRGRDKLIYDPEADTIYRFDLATDPAEDKNLYSPNGELDQELFLAALTAKPQQFAGELKNKETKEMLEDTILGLDPKHPGGAFEFLVSLAAISPSRKIESQLRRVYDESQNDNDRLTVQLNMFARNPKLWTSVLINYLKKNAGKKEELEYVDRLAAQGQPAFQHRFVAERMAWWATQSPPESIDPWLRLISRWPNKPESVYGALLTNMLRRMNEHRDTIVSSSERTALVLENLYSTKWKSGSETMSEAREAAHALFEYPDPIVQRAVYKALGRIGNDESKARLRAVFEATDRHIRVRQSALQAIVDLEKDAAIPLILTYCTEPKLQSDAIVLLGELGNPAGIPMLEEIARNHPKGTYRQAAQKTIDQILAKKK